MYSFQLLLKQIEKNPLKDKLKSQFKQIDEGYEGDQGEMSFKKSRKRAKADDEENDDNKMMRVNIFVFVLMIRWKMM